MSEAINIYSNLSDQKKFRLNEVNKIKYYFHGEIQEKKRTSKKLSKYVAAFDCFDNNLTLLSITSWGISITSFASIIGALVGIASASLSRIFSFSTGIIKKLLKIIRN